ncbi:DUF4917 family protein [Labilibaculum manganireducens]|uniref:DUF4917 family protein n=1 Tax=Labilibaculum manganireducens TaxID=1940525 RepID=UPI0029F58A67|nr:DUF4917 family protein [Labilibaculum manganireducens]
MNGIYNELRVIMKKHTILTYKEVINEIQHKENHLLIANGFNYGLGVNTGYGAIFNKMAKNNKKIYNDALKMVEDCDFDLEYFIGKLEEDINEDNTFLRKYISNKIKLDFMQATHEIVKSEIKNIYTDKNDGIFVLLKEFTNYFTLNYDSFLYLLLLKYKPIENKKKNAIAFMPSLKFIETDLDTNQNNIYSEIKNARVNGKLRLNLGSPSNSLEKDCRMLTKTHFTTEIKEYSKTHKKGWQTKDIDKVVKQIFQEEKSNEFLSKIDDGSKQQTLFDIPEFVYDVNSNTQNLFFLHGAFHIYKDGELYKKITQQSDKALYEKLEDVLNNDEQDVVCVFQRSNKTDAINNNDYLKHCFEKLACLSGNLVIIGSSLADNDDHIFEQINSSSIDKIYISAFGNMEEVFEAAKSKFPNKEIYLFDAKTISYEKPKEV